jgi:hypothetical protein
MQRDQRINSSVHLEYSAGRSREDPRIFKHELSRFRVPDPSELRDKRSGSLTMRSMLSARETSQNLMATTDESDNKSWDERWKMFYEGKISMEEQP